MRPGTPLYTHYWLANIGYCVEHGILRYKCGQASDADRIRLDCRFHGNTLFFQHRKAWLNGLLKFIERLVFPDRFDPAMATAISER